MTEGRLIAFTDNYADNSTEAGFQFTFFCDICREGYKTRFLECRSAKKRSLLKGVGGLVGSAAHLAGKYNVGYSVDRGLDTIAGRHQGMSAQWQKEHEAAFEQAQNEAKGHFHRCPRCTKWACANDFNEQSGLCTACAPRENVEVAAAHADRMVAGIHEKAAGTQVFTGEVEAKQTLCPQCGKPAGSGKFCGNCGASLALVECPTCGTRSPAGTRFCGECGARLE